MLMIKNGSHLSGIIKSPGLVFGDIGTSPIYTLSVVFLLTRPTPEHVIGILSLIIWMLVILVSVEYARLAMSLGERGEGGTIVLKKILVRLVDGVYLLSNTFKISPMVTGRSFWRPYLLLLWLSTPAAKGGCIDL